MLNYNKIKIFWMKTIIVPQPIYHTMPSNLFQDQDKQNTMFRYLNKKKGIKKARKMAEDQQKKVTELIKLL